MVEVIQKKSIKKSLKKYPKQTEFFKIGSNDGD